MVGGSTLAFLVEGTSVQFFSQVDAAIGFLLFICIQAACTTITNTSSHVDCCLVVVIYHVAYFAASLMYGTDMILKFVCKHIHTRQFNSIKQHFLYLQGCLEKC